MLAGAVGAKGECTSVELTPLPLLGLMVLGFVAGGVGSLTGIGGGLIITPVLTLLYGVPIHQAIATSLCCVIATSSGAAASFIEDRLSDVRLGMTLELATTAGAISGALLAGMVSRETLALLFATFLVFSAASMVRRGFGEMPSAGTAPESYTVRRLPLGLLGSGGAGAVSGLLGVGGGLIKVPLMYLAMGVPFKVATATSNFMIGVTAAASAFIYYARGDVQPLITAPAAVGVFVGAGVGARLMRWAPRRWLVLLLTSIMFYFAALMIWKSMHGGFTR